MLEMAGFESATCWIGVHKT